VGIATLPRDVHRMLANTSFTLGLVDTSTDQLVYFARAVTDYTCLAIILDVRTFGSRQYTSIRYTERFEELGAQPSVGPRGDAYDNAMAEAWVATYKSECVQGRTDPSFEHAEHDAVNWIGFYNNERLHEHLGAPHPPSTNTTESSPPRAARGPSASITLRCAGSFLT
jgi:transposase InsO family protein